MVYTCCVLKRICTLRDHEQWLDNIHATTRFPTADPFRNRSTLSKPWSVCFENGQRHCEAGSHIALVAMHSAVVSVDLIDGSGALDYLLPASLAHPGLFYTGKIGLIHCHTLQCSIAAYSATQSDCRKASASPDAICEPIRLQTSSSSCYFRAKASVWLWHCLLLLASR